MVQQVDITGSTEPKNSPQAPSAGIEAQLDPCWQVLPGVLGGLMGLAALVMSVAVGWSADNDPTTILLRSVVAMGLFWVAGFSAGWLVQRAVHADQTSVCAEDSGVGDVSDDSLQVDESAAETQGQREAA